MIEIIKGVVKNLDKGFYGAAKGLEKGPRTSYGFITDEMMSKGAFPSQTELDARVDKVLAHCNLKRENMYTRPNHMAQVEQYALDTWGLAKALEYEKIVTKGPNSDTVSKFFSTTSSAVLFPAYLESQIVLGMLAVSLLGALVATETSINAHTYKSLAFTDNEADQQLKRVGEGATLPKTSIKTSDKSIDLWKFGRVIDATYESIRLAKIDVVGIFFNRMGIRIGLDETDWAIETLIAGDGNSNAVVDTDCVTAGSVYYSDLVNLDLAFPQGYTMTTCVTNKTVLATLLNMAEFKDANAGFTFQRTGDVPSIMGATWHRWDSTNSTSYSTDRILAVDNSMALEQVTEQGVTLETDRIIEQQIQQTAITKWTGFAKLDSNATQCLDIS